MAAKTAKMIDAETPEIVETNTTTSKSKLNVKKKIPLDELVYVKNLTGGKLIYHSRSINGYYVEWQEYGEEVPIEMRELINMKNTDRIFFTENWIEVDIAVLRDLKMDMYYKDSITFDEIESIKNDDVEKIIKKIKKAKPIIKNSIGIRVMKMIEDGELTNVNTIKKLEEAIGCELFER